MRLEAYYSSYVAIGSKSRNLWRLLSSDVFHKKMQLLTFTTLAGWSLFVVVIYTLVFMFPCLFCLELLNFK